MTTQDHFPPPLQPKAKRPKRSFASLRAIAALVLREMETSYGKSPGGYLWAVLEPVGGIAIMTVIFSLGFRHPSIGVNFPIFFATGMLPFMIFNAVSGKIASALNYSKALLTYPTVTFIDALVARLIMTMVTEIMVAYIVFIGILAIYETRTDPNILVIATTFLMAAAFGLGVGSVNCFLFTMFPVWQRVWSVLTRPLFLISCVFYVFDTIPQPYRDYLWFNPVVHIVGYMRHGFYPSYDAPYVSLPYVFGVSMALFCIGLVFLRHYHRDLLHE